MSSLAHCRWLVVPLAFLLASVAAQNTTNRIIVDTTSVCNCTCTSIETNTSLAGCAYEDLVCLNGGQYLAPCEEFYNRTDYPTPEFAIQQYNALFPCTCPSGYNGTNCRLESPGVCRPGTTFDNSFINNNDPDKYMECFLEYIPSLGLLDHRVWVSARLPEGKLDVVLYNRPRNKTYDGYIIYAPVEKQLECNLTGCTGVQITNTDSFPLRYTCTSAVCTTCRTYNPKCNALLHTIATTITGTTAFKGSLLQPDGTYNIQLDTSAIVLGGVCRVGTCVDSSLGNDVTQGTVGSDPSGVIVVSAVGIFLCLVVAACTWRSMKPRAVDYNPDAMLTDAEEAQLAARRTMSLSISRKRMDVQLLFHDVRYSIKSGKGGDRQVLSDILGMAKSGELVAVMGSSGSGKTTLIDLLAQTPRKGVIQSSSRIHMFCNGKRLTPRRGHQLPERVSYMRADDCFMETQTVYEAVFFSARLRVPRSWEDRIVHDKVQMTLEDLQLQDVAHSIIGSPFTGGISTGERKRVAIAQELVVEPAVLFLDEPTSGLDSHTAHRLLMVLKKTAGSRGMLCVFSIHQPSSRVFNMFDSLLLLTRDGMLAYSGVSKEVIPYMTNVCGVQWPEFVNPAEVLLELSSDADEMKGLAESFQKSDEAEALRKEIGVRLEQVANDREERKSRVQSANEQWNMAPKAQRTSSPDHHGIEMSAMRGTSLSLLSSSGVVLQAREGAMATFPYQVGLLTRRLFAHVSRRPALLLLNMVLVMVAGVVLGLVFWDLELNFAGTQNRAGYLYFLCIFFSLINLASLPEFMEDRTRYLRERGDQFYGTAAYMVSRLLADLIPLRLLPPMVFAFTSYFMVGLQSTPSKFTIFVVILVLLNVTASAACFMVAALSKSPSRATLVVVLYFIFCTVFGGLFINEDGGSAMKYVIWIRYTSFFYYAYDAFMSNELGGLTFAFSIENEDTEFTFTGGFVLDQLAVGRNSLAMNIGLLAMLAVVFYIVSFVALHIKHSSR